MSSRMTRLGAAGILAAAASAGLWGCDGILDVDTGDVITPGDLDRAGPAGVATLVNGMAGTVHVGFAAVARYSALLSDEMVLAGTFPDRAQVDRRRILDDNGALTDEFYAPLHAARFQADTTVMILRERLDDPDFQGVRATMEEGIARGTLYGGYTRIWLAETMCWSILTGAYPEAAPLLPDERMGQAISILREAEEAATAGGLEEIRLAAILGQARARLWLGQFAEAAALADQVPRGFLFRAEFSRSNPDQYNPFYVVTWGDTDAIRWTVGDGTVTARGNEAWTYLGTFLALNLIRNRPAGFTSFQGSIPVLLQMRYGRAEAPIPIASGIEARLIRAEAHVRAGQTLQAQGILNDLRADFSLRAGLVWGVNPAPPAGALPPLVLTGSMSADLHMVADERARELWLTGDRQATARRFRLDDSAALNLFPPVKVAIGGGDDIAFPIVSRELEGNANLGTGDACPSGQAPGSWR